MKLLKIRPSCNIQSPQENFPIKPNDLLFCDQSKETDKL